MKILVTGSEGGVGQALIPLLMEQGHTIRGLDVADTAHGQFEGSHADDYEYICGDLRDFETVQKVMTGIDAVVHAGAIPNDRKDRDHDVMASNTQGTWNVLISAVKNDVGRVIHFSSINALGCVGGRQLPKYLPVDDGYPRHPNSPYQIAKHLSEEACKAFSSRWGIVTFSLRPMWILREQDRERTARWRSPERDEHMWSELWAYVDSRDVCDATIRALTVEGVSHEGLLLAADDALAQKPTYELVQTHLPQIPWRVSPEEWFAGNPHRGLLDCSRAKEVLGWQPQYSLK